MTNSKCLNCENFSYICGCVEERDPNACSLCNNHVIEDDKSQILAENTCKNCIWNSDTGCDFDEEPNDNCHFMTDPDFLHAK